MALLAAKPVVMVSPDFQTTFLIVDEALTDLEIIPGVNLSKLSYSVTN